MPEIQDTHLNKCIGCTYGKLFIMFYLYVKTYMEHSSAEKDTFGSFLTFLHS